MAADNPTIHDVAARAGVTKGTVSLVYSGKRPISAATRERVLQAAADLDWVPSSRARSLATKRSHTVGIVLARDPGIIATDTFFARFLSGVESVLTEHDMAVLLQIVTDRERERQAYRSLSRGRADGVLLLDLQVEDHRIDMLDELNLPAVVVGAHPRTGPHSRVYVDDQQAMTALLDHLITLGHRRIAHVSGPEQYVHAHQRRATFVEVMQQRGLDASLVVEGDFTAQSGRQATQHLLGLDEPPTAITFANDVMATAGLSYAHSAGLSVPGDVSITGFDDTELAAHLSPSLTTVHTDVVTWGQHAAHLLLSRLAGEPAGDLSIGAPTLVVRGSTAPA